jgi:putative flippase GtrA
MFHTEPFSFTIIRLFFRTLATMTFSHPFIKHKEVLVFFMVGTTNTLVGYGLFSFFLYCGLHYLAASFFATSIAITFSYHTTGKLVFKHKGSNVFLRFLGGCGINYLMNITLITIGTYFSSNLYLIAALALFPTASFSYFFNKYVIFPRRDHA